MSRGWLRVLRASLLMLVIAGVPVTPARAALVPAAYRAAILLRSLGYERGILAGKGDVLVLVLQGSDKASQADAKEMAATFTALSARMKVGERKLQVRTHQPGSPAETIKALTALAPAAVYFAAGLEALADKLAATADHAHWVPMCADGAQLGKGCALAVRTQDDASQLVVDLGRAKRAGLSFDARLLRLAKVIQ